MKHFLMFLVFALCSCAKTLAVVSSSAYLSSNLLNATGNGPIVSIPFNTITFDDAECFDTDTGEYHAPGNGTLIINGVIEVANLDPSHKTMGVLLVNKTTGEQRYLYAFNPYPLQNTVPPTGYCQLPYAETMKCSIGDIFVLKVHVIGGPQTVTITGGNRETRLTMNFFED